TSRRGRNKESLYVSQAEDGIRDFHVTGVQTCALPICTGSLVIRAEKIGAETVLAQIVQLVAQAQRSRAPMQRMADQVAYWFVLEIGRASCRERVRNDVERIAVENKQRKKAALADHYGS